MITLRLRQAARVAYEFARSLSRLRATERAVRKAWGDPFRVPFEYRGHGRFATIRPKQVEEEIRALFECVVASAPRFVCEIGTYRGGTFYLWCQAARESGTVIAVDLPGSSSLEQAFSRSRIQFYRQFAKAWTQRLHFIERDSHDVETARIIANILGRQRLDFLFIDGDHRYEGVKRDWMALHPLVRRGGMVAFHDILPRPDAPGIEVHRLWAELKPVYRHREIIASAGPWANQVGIGVLWLP